MVKITNGVNVFEVTRGAFDGIYSKQGYKVVNDKTAKNEKNNEEPEIPKKTDEEVFVEEILEKPISQWNKDEVKRFAGINEIDLTGTKNVNEAKELIKSFLYKREQE